MEHFYGILLMLVVMLRFLSSSSVSFQSVRCTCKCHCMELFFRSITSYALYLIDEAGYDSFSYRHVSFLCGDALVF